MENESVFGIEPEQLSELLSAGEDEPSGSSAQDAQSVSSKNHPSGEKPGSQEPGSAIDAFIEQPGSWVGPYKLLRVLGEGGMGIAYLAEQKQPMRRLVALKIIKPGMDSKRVIARFEAERQALALLDHPNIAHVYDGGSTELGRPYFVMEYVKGMPITDYCDHHEFTIEDRLRLFLQVCHAIHHAHQKGIIHRDIKPSNIVVSTLDDKPILKIIDFGVAKALSQPLTERTLITEQGQLFGTPEYMSPEQADMANEDIDIRSDIYSLGVLLYVLLTGALPFDSDTLRQGGIEHIRKVIRETDPKTPSTRLTKLGEEAKKLAEKRRTEVGALAKCLHRELEWIPLRAMRKERTERYRSASELADDIENYLNSAPLIAGPPGMLYRSKKFVRRHKALVAGVTAVLAVMIAGVVITTIFYIRAQRQARISEAYGSFLREDLLASVSPARRKGQDVTVRSLLDTASGRLNGKFNNEPLVEASIRYTLGWTYRMLGELKAAEPNLERALNLRQEHLGAEHPYTLVSMTALGHVYAGQGRYEEAKRLWATTFEIRRRVLGDEHPKTLLSMKDLAVAYMSLGRYDEAEQLFSRVIQISRLNEQDIMPEGHLVMLYKRQGRYVEAEAMCLKFIEKCRLKLGDEHHYTMSCMRLLADIYRQQCRYDEAEAQYLKTLGVLRRVLGEGHGYTLACMNGLALLYTEQGRYDEAGPLFEQALEIIHDMEGEEYPPTLALRQGLAMLRTKQKRYDEAEEILSEVLQDRRKKLGSDHPDTLETMHELSVVYVRQSLHDEAEPLLLEAVQGSVEKLKLQHPHTQESIGNLIELYESWNKPEQAAIWRAKIRE